MKISLNLHSVLLLVGWILAASASAALIVQHIKWTQQQVLWQSVLGEQEQKVVELETIIAELHLDMDRNAPESESEREYDPVRRTEAEPGRRASATLSDVADRVRSLFKRRPVEE